MITKRIQAPFARLGQAGQFLLFCLLLTSVSSVWVYANLGTTSVRMSKASIEKLGRQYGYNAKRRLVRWQNLMDDAAQDTEATKLTKVNSFFNRVRYLNDIDHWKQNDYWATPVEFLITNAGDCEDYSIAKYYTLRELGVADEKLSVAYVKALDYNQAHMVLTYYAKSGDVPLVLDNLIREIKPASERPDLLHVYSFNGDNLWLSRKGKRAELVGTSDRLTQWVKVQQRLNNTLLQAQ